MQENVKNDRCQRNAGIFVRQMFVIMNIILSMFIFSSVTTAAVNPDVQYNGHSYKIFNDGMTWQQAKKYCEGLGGHLVTITSVQEQDIVVGLLRNKGTKNSYWMGGYKNGSYWVWITEEPFHYSKWATWQPDGDGSALMMYRNKNPYAREGLGYWNDVSFTGECKNEPFFGAVNFGFVCEWDSTPNTVIPSNGKYGSREKSENHNPQGVVEIVESTSPNTLHVRGTAFDLDNPNGSTRLHVYVGGTPGSSVPQYEIRTDGNSRIFDDTREIDSNYSGRQLVHIYALNDYGGGDYVQIWEGYVDIQSAWHNPQGVVEIVESTSPNTLHVRGTAFDLDNPNGSTRLHVYVGGTPGSSVPQYEIRTDGNSRIFDDTREIDSNYSGHQLVHIYALNDYGDGEFVQIWEGYVEIKANNDYMTEPMKNWYCTWSSHSNWSWGDYNYNSKNPERSWHLGLDVYGDNGYVYSMADGVVASYSDSNNGGGANGRYIVIKHTIKEQTFYSFYAHLASVNVHTNQIVRAGEHIGIAGGSGYGKDHYYGVHLHFAIVNKLKQGNYYGYATKFSGDKVTFGDVTFYNPRYVLSNGRLP